MGTAYPTNGHLRDEVSPPRRRGSSETAEADNAVGFPPPRE